MPAVRLTPEAIEQLEALNEPIHGRILKMLERLNDWPAVSGAKPLTGVLAGRWRLRTGDYRLQFRVVRDTITIEKIGHRDRFYEE